jgi:hypothetical protein
MDVKKEEVVPKRERGREAALKANLVEDLSKAGVSTLTRRKRRRGCRSHTLHLRNS